MPKYSVIIPIYNVENYLNACVDSVLNQNTSEDYEIILIDDGSPDRSGAICDRYAQNHKNIRVFHDTNHGVSHARNVGIDMAAGEYIFFLDADDLWERNLLKIVSPLLDKKPDMAWYGHTCFYEDDTKEPCILRQVPAGETGTQYLSRLFAENLVPEVYPWCYAYRKDFLNAHQLRFQEDLKVSEDFVFNMSALAAAELVTGTDMLLYGYRIRTGSVTATLSAKKLMDNLTTKAAFFRKYPVPAMANFYAENAILIVNLPKEEAQEAAQDEHNVTSCAA